MYANKLKSEITVAIVVAVFFLILIFSSSAEADCVDDSQNGKATATLSWIAATERADDSPYLIEEQAGYKVYYTDKSDGTNCIRMIPDNSVLLAVFNIHEGVQYDFWMTSFDTDGKESINSEIITYGIEFPEVPVIPPVEPPTPPETLQPPNTITNFVITQITPDELNYIFNFKHAKDDNGDHFPIDMVVIYKLYLNDEVVREVTIDEVPFIMELTAGDYIAEVEVDITSTDGQNAVSDRSIAKLFTVESITAPPSPPFRLEMLIPEGAKSIIVTFGN